MPDEIIEELWGIKDGIAREHGGDIQRLAAYLQSKRVTATSYAREGGGDDQTHDRDHRA